MGPFVGVFDSANPALQKPDHATDIRNCVLDISGGGALVERPGFTRASATQMGSGSAGQCIIDHVSLAGTRFTFFVVGGLLYRYTWATSTVTDVTPVGVSINSAAAYVFAVTFADVIIVTDGVNRPWKMTNLSSTPVTGTYLTGVPGVVFGPPAVYYAKLFFIKNDERHTIIWSSENDPDNGYEDGDFENAWTLAQTDQNRLTCLIATNDRLYYFRDRSIGAVSGAANADFMNDGVHDGVSATDGAPNPASVGLIGDTGAIYFANQDAYAHKVEGLGVVPIWADIAETQDAVGTVGDVYYSPDLDSVLWNNLGTGQYVYHMPTGKWLGRWFISGGATFFSRMGLAVAQSGGAQGKQVVLGLTTDGYVFQQKLQSQDDGDDYLDGSTPAAVDHLVTTPIMGYSDTVHQVFDQTDITMRGFSGQTTHFDVSWNTPSESGAAVDLTFPVAAAAGKDTKASLGINAHGRGISVTIAHDSTDTRFSLRTVRVSGAAVSDAPGQN